MDLIYDWNRRESTGQAARVMLADETLRDGLQSASVRTPTIDEKLEILHLMERLRLDVADIGLPGAGAHVAADVERLAARSSASVSRYAPTARRGPSPPTFSPSSTSRSGWACPIEVAAVHRVEPRSGSTSRTGRVDFLDRTTEEAVTFAVREGLPVLYVTEDTTRAHPDTLRRLYRAAIRAGASRVCVSDTVGHATPGGVARRRRVRSRHRRRVRRRASASTGTGTAIAASAWSTRSPRSRPAPTRLHATALGVGERVGNTELDCCW